MEIIIKHTRRAAIFVAGLVVFMIGCILALPGIPGPGIVIMIAGIAIWSTEFAWALVWRQRAEAWFARTILKKPSPKLKSPRSK